MRNWPQTLKLLFRPPADKWQVAEFQSICLRHLIRHAAQNVPFYRELYRRHKISPKDIRTNNDIRRLPLIDKSDLRRLPPKEIVASGVAPNRLITHSTSGTTGVPTTTRRTWFEERLLNFFKWKVRFYYGAGPWSKSVKLSLGLAPQTLSHRLASTLGLFRNHEIDLLASSEDLLRQLVTLRPDVISGYPGALAGVGSIMDEKHRRLLKPRLIITGGEPLTPGLRRTISTGFQARVFDYYGCFEFNCIAWECKHTGHLHTCDENVIVEILKEGEPVVEGGTGEVVCTALHSYAMPLIRFRLGDTAVKGPAPCPCGVPYASIEQVEGRVTDYFVRPSGQKFHSYRLFDPIFRHAYPWIRQYQLIQTESDQVMLKLVPMEPDNSFQLTDLEKECQRILGPDMRFKVMLVNAIPPLPSGKIPTYRCLVKEQPFETCPPFLRGGPSF